MQRSTPEHAPEAPTTTDSSVYDRANGGDIDAQWEINLALHAETKAECQQKCNGLVKVQLQSVSRGRLIRQLNPTQRRTPFSHAKGKTTPKTYRGLPGEGTQAGAIWERFWRQSGAGGER